MVLAVDSMSLSVPSSARPSRTSSRSPSSTLRPTRQGVHFPQLCVAHIDTTARVNSTGHGSSELHSRRLSSAWCISSITAWASLRSNTYMRDI